MFCVEKLDLHKLEDVGIGARLNKENNTVNVYPNCGDEMMMNLMTGQNCQNSNKI